MENMQPKKHINRKERIGGLAYVILFFCAGVGISVWLLLSESNLAHIFSQKDSVRAKMERQQNFRQVQAKYADVCDMLSENISAYDPGVNAVYEKGDIQYVVNEIKKQYEVNRYDRRYAVFRHVSDFYQMWFNDRQYLWSLGSNLDYLKRNLEECELGLERKKEDLKTGN